MKIDLLKDTLTSQGVINNLYSFPVKLQLCHHNTTSYAKHKALDFAYDALSTLKDDVIEKLIGYGVPRFHSVTIGTISADNVEIYSKTLAKEIMSFGKSLEKFASEKGYCDIENLAQEYSGVGAKLNYLLTLS